MGSALDIFWGNLPCKDVVFDGLLPCHCCVLFHLVFEVSQIFIDDECRPQRIPSCFLFPTALINKYSFFKREFLSGTCTESMECID